MSTQLIVPCLWMDDQAEQAAALYTRLFAGGRIVAVSHYPESIDNPSGKLRGSVLTVEFEIAGMRFTALNGGPIFKINPTISFFVHAETQVEADRLFAALAEGGKVLMPLGSYPWSERYGWVADRFGVSWQVITGRSVTGGATIVPCLMFAGGQHGKAETALRTYTQIFPNGRIEGLERYAAGEGPTGTIKHGRCSLAGQSLVAMDSHIDHGVSFDEGLSLQVMCSDQAEIDRYWEALGKDGKPGPCGWLKDRFGLSWQVVPGNIAQLLTSKDTAARDRAFAAMMRMGKPDVAALQAAFEGRS
jgi:predicted 3-demethylubiquinone-9 3-methyltransferase (glyoxalase superfamily)